MMDISNNPYLLLGKTKEYILYFINELQIEIYCFPEDQKQDGFNIIQAGGILFWFDCFDVLYCIQAKYHDDSFKESLSISLYDIKINQEGYAETVISFLNTRGVLHWEKSICDQDIGKYRIMVFFTNDQVSYIINYDETNTISEFSIQYDGYSAYQYKKGIGLDEYLHT